ncbi:GYF domain-containing protein [Orbaceae bacterium ac157xtp]
MDGLENKWFYELSGKRVGPVSEKGMIALIKTKVISYGNVVWKSDYPDWVNLENSELRQYLTSITPPPLTGVNVNNTVVWILAFAPIISSILIMIILAFIYGGNEYRMMNAYSDGEFWWMALVVNIFLSAIDEHILQKSGNDTSKFRGWLWLVPVYLFQRAKFLKQNQAYFWVWIVTFFLFIVS